jgi:hypothetical protein
MEGTIELPEKANIGGIFLKKVVDGKTPEHYAWKKKLEREWAWEWGTLARLTKYRYKIGLDPAFVVEQPQFKKGELHWYEWILCGNGGFIYLYDDAAKILTLTTTTQTGQKVLDGVKEANLALEFDERLSREIRFPLSVIHKVCELAGARRARTLSAEAKANLAERMKGYRFKPSEHAVESPETAQI